MNAEFFKGRHGEYLVYDLGGWGESQLTRQEMVLFLTQGTKENEVGEQAIRNVCTTGFYIQNFKIEGEIV